MMMITIITINKNIIQERKPDKKRSSPIPTFIWLSILDFAPTFFTTIFLITHQHHGVTYLSNLNARYEQYTTIGISWVYYCMY